MASAESMQLKINKSALLLILWSFLTVVNICKSVHIDDPYHLYAAMHIAENPVDPHSGWINWGDDPTQMYTGNQPPLLYYLMAIISVPFGMNIIPLHLLISIFSFLALFFFQKILDHLKSERPHALLILFAFCPAFMVNQNIMVDIPILSMMLGMAYFLLKAGNSKKRSDYFKAAFLLGFGLLFKYSLLPLILVFAIVLMVRKEYKNLLFLLIPISMVGAWSLWTYAGYDSFHVWARRKGGIHIGKFWGYLSCLGSISTFIIPLLFILRSHRLVKTLLAVLISCFLVISILFSIDILSYIQCSIALSKLFILQGSIVFIIICTIVLRQIVKNFSEFMLTCDALFFLFLSSIGLFIVLFVPFMATRHVLLAIPFILLLGRKLVTQTPVKFLLLSIILSFFLSLSLGISDWHYAKYYEIMAEKIKIPDDAKLWSVGHWGWHWYSKKQGAEIYGTTSSVPQIGDILIYAENTPKQDIAEDLRLELVGKKWEEASPWTFISVSDGASLYNSSDKIPAWTLSKYPMDTIFIMRVIE